MRRSPWCLMVGTRTEWTLLLSALCWWIDRYDRSPLITTNHAKKAELFEVPTPTLLRLILQMRFPNNLCSGFERLIYQFFGRETTRLAVVFHWHPQRVVKMRSCTSSCFNATLLHSGPTPACHANKSYSGLMLKNCQFLQLKLCIFASGFTNLTSSYAQPTLFVVCMVCPISAGSGPRTQDGG